VHLLWRFLAGLAKCLCAGLSPDHARASKEAATHGLCHMCSCGG
jgi:hypothetical protein